jgi:hypothetical protein
MAAIFKSIAPPLLERIDIHHCQSFSSQNTLSILLLVVLSRGRMSSHGGLFLPNGKDQRSVHRQGFNRDSPRRREAHQPDTVPPKMIAPHIDPRVVQAHFLA